MVASRAAARAEEGRQRRRRENVATLEQPSQKGGHTLDLDVMTTIKQLPLYLQPVVTLMSNMVPPSEEERLRNKKGKEALA